MYISPPRPTRESRGKILHTRNHKSDNSFENTTDNPLDNSSEIHGGSDNPLENTADN